MNEKSPNPCLGEELERLFRCVLLSRDSPLNQFVSSAKFMPDRHQCGLALFAGHFYGRQEKNGPRNDTYLTLLMPMNHKKVVIIGG